MKIGIICPYNYIRSGGVQYHIRDLAKELRHLGHEVKVITPNVIGKNTDKDYPDVFFIGMPRELHVFGTTPDFSIALGEELKDLRKFIKKEKFDVLHFHEPDVPFLSWQLLPMSKTAKVATYHSTPKGEGFRQPIESFLFGLISYLTNKIFRISEVITVSETPAKIYKRFNRNLKIIPNGIFVEDFDPSKTKPFEKYKDEKINILFLGRLEPRKGADIMLDAYKILKSYHPNIRLLLAGKGYLENRLKKKIEKENIKDVEMLGFVPDEEKASWFATCDIFCSPAPHGESFGIVLLEAMASGKPALGAANTGYKTVLKDKGEALLFEPNDIAALVTKLKEFILDEKLRKEFGKWGLTESKRYDWSKVAKEIERIYVDALK